MSASPAVRSLRAAVFAVVCVLLAAAGHGLAMGDMPPLWADGAGVAAVFVPGWLLGGRERSLPGIGVVMLATQGALHIAFDLAERAVSTRSGPVAAMGMADPRMHGHAMATMPGASDSHAVTAHASAAHLLAALAASWWLRRGEAALWSLLRRAGALVPGLVAWWRGAPLPVQAGRVPRVPVGAEPPRRTLLRYAVRRRGPPPPIPYPV